MSPRKDQQTGAALVPLLPLVWLLAIAGPLHAGPTAPRPLEAAPGPAAGDGSPTANLGPAANSLDRLLAGRPQVNETLTLDQAVAIALRESPAIRGAVAETEAALGRLNAARAETRPWLSANGFLSGGNNPNHISTPRVTEPQMIMGLPDGLFLDANLMLMYPLYTGGRLQALVRQAAALRRASEAQLEVQRQQAALLTRAAYREVLARRALVEVWQARLREDEERLRVDRLRLREGQIPAFYVLRDEAEVAATRQELTNAERDLQLSLLQLKTVMGISPASTLTVPGVLEYQPSLELIRRLGAQAGFIPSGDDPRIPGDAPANAPAGAPAASALPAVAVQPLSPEVAALLRLAERQRPELRAANQQVRAARTATEGIRSGYRPQVNLFAMGDLMSMRPLAGITFGAVASLPLYTGGQRRARIQTAEAERRQEEQEREQLALQVGQEVLSTILNLRSAEQNVQTARAALAAAREDYRVAVLRYEAGRSIVVEVLDALAARVRAESNLVQALFQYNVAQDYLLRAVGALHAPSADRSEEPVRPADPMPPAQPVSPRPGAPDGKEVP